MTTPSDLLDRAANAEGGLQGIVQQGIGGVLLGIATMLISGILTVGDLFIIPITALANALGSIVEAIFGSPANIILAGMQATVESLLGPFNLGPLTFALGIAAVLLGFYLVNLYVSRPETGNLIPGLPFDVPTPFVEDPEEDDEES